MFKIELRHGDGSPFNPQRFRQELELGIRKAAEAKIDSEVRQVRCPVHGQTATVTPTFPGREYRVRGCCQQLIDAVKARLGS